MVELLRKNLRDILKQGALAGVITLSVSVIGMVELFGQRDLVGGLLTMGQVLVFAPPALFAFIAARTTTETRDPTSLICGLMVGLIAAIPLIILVFLTENFNLRQFLPNVSPAVVDLVTFDQGATTGSLLLLASMGVVGMLGAGLYFIPERYRTPILYGLIGTLTVGLFSEILSERLRSFFGSGFSQLIFRSKALRPPVAGMLFIGISGFALWRASWLQRESRPWERMVSRIGEQRFRWVQIGAVSLFMLVLPLLLGTYLSEVMNNVGIFVLMGLGLNIVVGFAGLLDLGYVAFFAIGAYSMGLLTSTGALGVGTVSFWLALPICMLVSLFAGVILGMPVLRMRGDYLAIVTLGFGEIIRILALSDLLKPFIGGAQGILQIPKPELFGMQLIQPGQLYYVILAGCLLAAFVSWRLSEARLGRQWMAMREDEDVAEAMGINLVSTKLLAFALGASFAGLSGAIFASKLTSIFPHSFNLLISINVLCLIIVGGMGSLPGVVAGSLVLVGLPELLREFAEYRLLMYGALLIVMMLARPEGFLPSAVRRRELHAHEEMVSAETAAAGD